MTSLGNITPAGLWLGQLQAKSAWLGDKEIWSGGSPTPPTPTGDWLCFTAEEANSTVVLSTYGNPDAISLETSYNGDTWSDYTIGDSLILVNVGDKVYFRAKSENLTFSTAEAAYYTFSNSTGKLAASGNIQSLLKADCSRTDAPAYCYYGLFRNCSALTQTPELPATTLNSSCYASMFQGCTSLTAAPALPATTLNSSCYASMFQGCTSLTAAPALPATVLAGTNNCYQYMFQNCTSLSTAPALPATTLGTNCYYGMFRGCTSLTAAPELPATTVVYYCYSGMFQGCTSLSTAPALPATTLDANCYENMFRNCSKLTSIDVSFTAWSPSGATSWWVNGVAAAGTFKCPTALGTNETITRGVSNCPAGWTVVNIDAA